MTNETSEAQRRSLWMLGLGVVLGASIGTIYGAGVGDLVAGILWGIGIGIIAGGLFLLVRGR